jgi:hypothetical protein
LFGKIAKKSFPPFSPQKEEEKIEKEIKEEIKEEVKGNKRKRHVSCPDITVTKKVAVDKTGSCSQ